MEHRVTVITLGVAALGRSARFYEDGLGWRRATRDEGVVFFQLPGAVLSLWSRAMLAEDGGVEDRAGGFAGIALAYNTRSREEVSAVLAKAKAAGGTVTREARDVFWGGHNGYFTDPDGHLWEVAFNPGWPIDGEGRLTIPG
jgi:catechol 2,3-dioxygenase-like lactoylglutathione lyase family enzyme